MGSYIVAIEKGNKTISLLTFGSSTKSGEELIVVAVRNSKCNWAKLPRTIFNTKLKFCPPSEKNLRAANDASFVAEGKKNTKNEKSYELFCGINDEDLQILVKDNNLEKSPAQIWHKFQRNFSTDLAYWLKGAAAKDNATDESKLAIDLSLLEPLPYDEAQQIKEDLEDVIGDLAIVLNNEIPIQQIPIGCIPLRLSLRTVRFGG